jgi:DNA-binding LacI/PurR family transcriptional regulator
MESSIARQRGGTRSGPSRRAAKAPTIFDVAAAAGVSKSTVSNVVRGTEEVAAKTRSRVLEAIERLDYKPNAIARQFVRQRTTILASLVGDLRIPLYAELAQATERAAFRSGYSTILSSIDAADEHAAPRIEALLEQRVAGIVCIAQSSRSPEFDSALRRAQIPAVFLGVSEEWSDSVSPHDAKGGRLATEHLVSLGHRRIAYVRTPLVADSADRARHAGYRSAMRAADLPAMPPIHWEPGADQVRIARQGQDLDAALQDLDGPTALFVSNDSAAVSLVELCEARGRSVPRDVSIVGFDDIGLAALHRISLTTIAQPCEYQADQAVELLLERIENPGLPTRRVSAPVELRVRGSTAPVRR